MGFNPWACRLIVQIIAKEYDLANYKRVPYHKTLVIATCCFRAQVRQVRPPQLQDSCSAELRAARPVPAR